MDQTVVYNTPSIYEVLDAFALAAETGILEEDGWSRQFFSTRQA